MVFNVLDLFSGIGGFSHGLESIDGGAVLRPLHFAKSMPVAEHASHCAGRACQSSTISGCSMPTISNCSDCRCLTCCAAGSLAKMLAEPPSNTEPAKGSSDRNQVCGSSISGLSKRSARGGPSSKTLKICAIGDWEQSSHNSLRSGTMRNGISYPLAPLAHLTKEKGYGFWPTPVKSDYKGAVSLARANERWKRSSRGVTLAEHITRTEQIEVGGNLNPNFVEWLMGYPIGWTDLNNSAIH